MMMMNVRVISSVLLGLSLAALGGEAQPEGPRSVAVSENIHAVVKVQSTNAYTIVSVPWTFYTPTGSSDTNLPIDRLIRPTNLTLGDRVLALLPDGNGGTKYAAWELVRSKDKNGNDEPIPGIVNPVAENDNHWCWAWQPIMTVTQNGTVTNGVGRSEVFFPENSETNTACRGYGIWLCRQNPLENDGRARSFYLYGQWADGNATVKIPAGTGEAPTSVMLANPDCSRETDVNDAGLLGVTVGTIGADDTLIITTDAKTSFFCYRMNNRWCYSRQELVNVNEGKFKSDGVTPKAERWVVQTVYHDAPKVPAGTGFWYVRRTEGELTLEWKASSNE